MRKREILPAISSSREPLPSSLSRFRVFAFDSSSLTWKFPGLCYIQLHITVDRYVCIINLYVYMDDSLRVNSVVLMIQPTLCISLSNSLPLFLNLLYIYIFIPYFNLVYIIKGMIPLTLTEENDYYYRYHRLIG